MLKKSLFYVGFFGIILIACSKVTETVTPATNVTTPPTTGTGTTTTTGTYNDLWIPPTLTGTTFNLALGKSTKQFRTGTATNTYGYNGVSFWGPTLIMNKGDNVQRSEEHTSELQSRQSSRMPSSA